VRPAVARRPARILVVDDEPDMADSVRLILVRAGHEVLVQGEGRAAVEMAVAERPDLVITDLRMPGLDGLGVIEELKARGCAAPVVVLTGYASIDSAVEAMRRGAIDYLSKPFSPDELVLRAERALAWSQLAEQNRYLRERIDSEAPHHTIVGESGPLAEVLRLIDKVAPTDARILIVGESGTGKELVARTIHRRSLRREAPFVALNCGALAEALLESELFGHERGAFTGALGLRKGFFEVADGGTLFLDEVSETTPAFQTKLLRVIQEGEFVRVGGTRALRTDVRVLASTNRDPRRAIAEGKLRDDLFYRLSVVQIALPPLRDRIGDIPLLAAHFASLYARQIKKRVASIEPDALEALARYAWPGNIRELENVVERAVIMADEGGPIGLHDLPDDLLAASEALLPVAQAGPMRELREAEREILLRALRESRGNRSLAARRLGIGRRTLYDKLERLGISVPDEA
jgi:DNA-binding NtrC family response regulator